MVSDCNLLFRLLIVNQWCVLPNLEFHMKMGLVLQAFQPMDINELTEDDFSRRDQACRILSEAFLYNSCSEVHYFLWWLCCFLKFIWAKETHIFTYKLKSWPWRPHFWFFYFFEGSVTQVTYLEMLNSSTAAVATSHFLFVNTQWTVRKKRCVDNDALRESLLEAFPMWHRSCWSWWVRIHEGVLNCGAHTDVTMK